MTPLEKQQIWDALYKCTRNGYPGATYETYDSPKDPRVRGGRYPWKRAQLREIYEQLVKWGDLNEPTAAWRELLKYKTKIPPACLRAIYQSITFGFSPLRTVWDDIANVPVANVNSVSDWQAFYDGSFLGSFATTFSSVVVTGNIVDLYPVSPNPSTLAVFTFSTNLNLLEFIDFHGIISGLDFGCFENTENLRYVYLPGHPSSPLLHIFDYAFFQSGTNITSGTQTSIGNFPSVTSINDGVFQYSRLWASLSFPAATAIGFAAFADMHDIGYLDVRSFINTGILNITDYISGFVTPSITIILDQSWQQQLLNVTNIPYSTCRIVIMFQLSTGYITFYNATQTVYDLGGNNSGTLNFVAGANDQIVFTLGGPNPAVYGLNYFYQITGTGITQADFINPISNPVPLNGSFTKIPIRPNPSAVGKSFTFSVYQGVNNTGPLLVNDTYNII